MIKQALKQLKEYYVIKKSGMFDPVYYLLNNADVRQADVDPLWHFVRFGWKEGRNPSEYFNTSYYQNTYPDIKSANINPLFHYILHGKVERRIINCEDTTSNIIYKRSIPTPASKWPFTSNFKVIRKIQKAGWKYVIQRGIFIFQHEGIGSFIDHLFQKNDRNASIKTLQKASVFYANDKNIISDGNALIVAEFQEKVFFDKHSNIDIIICVHNALEDFIKCYKSIIIHSSEPYHIIIIDDGSNEETKNYLNSLLQSSKNIEVISNPQAHGYTRAANQGLHLAKAKFVVLVNSDTIVTAGWLEKMASVFHMNSRVGMVGPMSNTASWQSIPHIFEGTDWAKNILPEDFSVDQFATALTKLSNPVFPEVPFLNGFCMMIRKEVITDIGYFDDKTFPEGYGEEDDYILRARKAGWEARWADNVYVYHAQSRSFTDARRMELSSRGMKALINKQGEEIISEGCQQLQKSLVLNGIREHSSHLYERAKIIKNGRKLFEKKRLLFVLPIAAPVEGQM